METLLEVRGLSVEFPGVKALDSVDFSLHRGEVVALLGENGAGKSTLIKALTGVYKRSAGEVYLDGKAICPIDTADAQKMGIGTVYQEVNLLPNISVAANLFIGREPLRWGMIDHRTMNQQAEKLLTGYGLALDVQQPLANFSIAIQQIVAIARAVDLSAKVLILDEPTASLDAKEVSMLLDILRQLRDQGIGMVFVTHFLDQVYRISDRITVFRNGKLVGTKTTAELPRIELVQMMLGHSFDEQLLKRGEHNIAASHPLVEFKNYGRRGVVESFDLSVSPGEIVGLAGLLGSGRTETAQLIFGVTTPDTGEAKIQGKPVKIRTPVKHQNSVLAIAQKIAKQMVSSVRQQYGKILSWPYKHNAAGSAPSQCANKLKLLKSLFSNWVFVLPAPNSKFSISPVETSKRCYSPAGLPQNHDF